MSKYSVTFDALFEKRDVEAGYTWNLGERIKNIPHFKLLYDTNGEHKQAIIDKLRAKYRMREIGFETPQLFFNYLSDHILLNIDRWNKLIELIDEAENVDLSSFYQSSSTFTPHIKDSTILEIEYGRKDDGGNTTTYGRTTTQNDGRNTDTREIINDTPEKGINLDAEWTTENYASNTSHSRTRNSGDILTTNDGSDGVVSHNYQSGKDKHTTTIEHTGSDSTINREKMPLEMLPTTLVKKIKDELFVIDEYIVRSFEPLFMQIY